MACQKSSHRGVGDESIVPKDVHGDLSSNNSNIAAGKYIVDIEKFTTVGLSSKIFYRGILLLRGKDEKMKPIKYISTNSKETEIINGIFPT